MSCRARIRAPMRPPLQPAAVLPSRLARAWLKTARADGWLAWPRDVGGAEASQRLVAECKRSGWAMFAEGFLEAGAPSPYRITEAGRAAVAAEPELAL